MKDHLRWAAHSIVRGIQYPLYLHGSNIESYMGLYVANHLGPLLIIRINLNPNMDK